MKAETLTHGVQTRQLEPVPADIDEAIVNALADALVLAYLADAAAKDETSQGSNHLDSSLVDRRSKKDTSGPNDECWGVVPFPRPKLNRIV
jgi:hypothetical protein